MRNSKFVIQNSEFVPTPLVTRHPPLVLTGFMGTGKTAVGRIIAQRLRREFVDMDAVIEARAGAQIAEIFERKGEAYFRALETALCDELSRRRGLVIATGGGTLVSQQNRARFADAVVVCLDASVDEIVARLQGARNRPLLANGELRARVEQLQRARRDAYRQIEWHVDTTGVSVGQVTERVIELFERVSDAKH